LLALVLAIKSGRRRNCRVENIHRRIEDDAAAGRCARGADRNVATTRHRGRKHSAGRHRALVHGFGITGCTKRFQPHRASSPMIEVLKPLSGETRFIGNRAGVSR
jgi:hypothetical protein